MTLALVLSIRRISCPPGISVALAVAALTLAPAAAPQHWQGPDQNHSNEQSFQQQKRGGNVSDGIGLLISITFHFIANLDTFPGLSSCKLTIIKGQIMGAPIKRTPHKRMTDLEKENWRFPANCILFNRLIEGPRDFHIKRNLQTCFSNRLNFIASNFRKLEDNENIIELSVREYSTWCRPRIFSLLETLSWRGAWQGGERGRWWRHRAATPSTQSPGPGRSWSPQSSHRGYPRPWHRDNEWQVSDDEMSPDRLGAQQHQVLVTVHRAAAAQDYRETENHCWHPDIQSFREVTCETSFMTWLF